jgi:cytoskeletal protein RodZ
MRWSRKTFWWGLVLGLMFIGLATLPVAWAMPEVHERLQTIPTRTPTAQPVPNTPIPPRATQPTQPQPPTETPVPPTPAGVPATTAPTATAIRPTVTSTAVLTPAIAEPPSSDAEGTATVEPADVGGASGPAEGLRTVTATVPVEQPGTPSPTAGVQPSASPTATGVAGSEDVADLPAVASDTRSEPVGRFSWLFVGGALLLAAGGAVLFYSKR